MALPNSNTRTLVKGSYLGPGNSTYDIYNYVSKTVFELGVTRDFLLSSGSVGDAPETLQNLLEITGSGCGNSVTASIVNVTLSGSWRYTGTTVTGTGACTGNTSLERELKITLVRASDNFPFTNFGAPITVNGIFSKSISDAGDPDWPGILESFQLTIGTGQTSGSYTFYDPEYYVVIDCEEYRRTDFILQNATGSEYSIYGGGGVNFNMNLDTGPY